MLTLEPGIADAVPKARRRLPAAGLGLGLAVAGVGAGALAGDSCSPGLALPASGLALTVAGTALWLTGMPRERRDRMALSIAVGLALLSVAALQRFLTCMLGREAMAIADLLQAGGIVMLLVALALGLDRVRRTRAAAARRRRLRELHERAARRRAERVGAAEPQQLALTD